MVLSTSPRSGHHNRRRGSVSRRLPTAPQGHPLQLSFCPCRLGRTWQLRLLRWRCRPLGASRGIEERRANQACQSDGGEEQHATVDDNDRSSMVRARRDKKVGSAKLPDAVVGRHWLHPKVTVLYCTVRLYAMLAPSGFLVWSECATHRHSQTDARCDVGAQRLAAEIEVLRAALAESEATIAMLLELQAETLSENEDDPVTQGMPAAMPRPLTPPAADDDEPEMTQGEPSAPRRVLACSPRTRLPSVMRIAFVGIRDAQNCTAQGNGHSAWRPSGAADTSQQRSRVVCVPSVGARRSAMSIFAALSKKILVTPRWIEASAQGGAFVLSLLPLRACRRRAAAGTLRRRDCNGKRRDADEGTERYWQNQRGINQGIVGLCPWLQFQRG